VTRRLALAAACLLGAACTSSPSGEAGAQPLPACEWCGTGEAPEDLAWETRIAPPDEPGELLVVEGVVYEPDGMTPVPGVVLYLYHTNAAGVYPRRGDETGNGRRHGYLRAWLRTDDAGRYRFTTIRPGAYPGGGAPAHIHVTVEEPGRGEYYVDDFVFEGDPALTPAYRARLHGRGGSGIVTLTRDAEGVWRGTRDFVLER
jgi:protocatechuate 3,4-dioxygenase beta subunit